MSRTPDAARRAQILDRCVDYVLAHGLAELSLRPLAKAAGTSPRVLLYYFKSKEELVVEIIRRGRARQRETMVNLKLRSDLSAREVSRILWQHYTSPEWEPLMRLFFEVYGLALQDRSRFPGFLEGAVEEWLLALEPCSTLPGYTREDARAYATVLIAGFRGFSLDLCATHDRARIDRAVDLWLSLLDSSPVRRNNSMQQAESKPQRRGATLFIFITVAIDMISIGIIAPVLPKLIANFLGGNLSHAAEITGIFATVWAAMQFVCSPLLGMLSDRVGRRPVILISCAVTAIDFGIMAMAPNLWWLFAGRVLSGIATANISTAYAYIADVTSHEKRAQAYGLLSSAFGLGFIIGPAIGGLAGNVDPRLPFWIAAGFSLINTLYGLFVLPESLPRELRTKVLDFKRANPIGSLKLLRRHHELYGLAGVSFITLIAHEALPVLWVLYLIAQFGWDERAIGLTLALVGVVSSITAATLVAPVIKLLGERRTLLVGLVTFTAGNVLIGFSNMWAFVAGIIVLCLSIYNSPAQSLMSKHVGPSEQGELQGALGSLRGISMMIGPPIFALAFALVAGPWRSLDILGGPFFLAAAMLVVAIAVAWRVTSREDDVVLPLPEAAPVTMVEG